MHNLYTYRSVSKAIPSVKNDLQNKNEVYELIRDVINPEIDKVTFFFFKSF
jgi:hypothetical protein